MQESNRHSQLQRLTPLELHLVSIYVTILTIRKRIPRFLYLAAIAVLALLLYAHTPPHPLRLVLAIGASLSITLTIVSLRLLAHAVLMPNNRTC